MLIIARLVLLVAITGFFASPTIFLSPSSSFLPLPCESISVRSLVDRNIAGRLYQLVDQIDQILQEEEEKEEEERDNSNSNEYEMNLSQEDSSLFGMTPSMIASEGEPDLPDVKRSQSAVSSPHKRFFSSPPPSTSSSIRPLRVTTVSWNQENHEATFADLSQILSSQDEANSDVVVTCQQESTKGMMYGPALEVLNRYAASSGLGSWKSVFSHHQNGMTEARLNYLGVGILIRSSSSLISVSKGHYRQGLEGKGGVWVKFVHSSSNFPIGVVCAHLDSHSAAGREGDIDGLMKSFLGLEDEATVDDVNQAFDKSPVQALLWAGDLNYRWFLPSAPDSLGMFAGVTRRELVKAMSSNLNSFNQYDSLDQTSKFKIAGGYGFECNTPSYPPTYKRGLGPYGAQKCLEFSKQWEQQNSFNEDLFYECTFGAPVGLGCSQIEKSLLPFSSPTVINKFADCRDKPMNSNSYQYDDNGGVKVSPLSDATGAELQMGHLDRVCVKINNRLGAKFNFQKDEAILEVTQSDHVPVVIATTFN